MADQGHSGNLLWSSDLQLDLLGPVRLSDLAGADYTPRSRKTRALLTIVALAGRPVPRVVLADLLWGDRGEEQAKASLRQALYELRGLGNAGYIASSRETVGPGLKRLQTDLALLEHHADKSDAAAIAELLPSLTVPILGTLDDITPEFDEWLREKRAATLQRLIERCAGAAEDSLSRGDCQSARRIATELSRLDPLDQNVARIGIVADLAAGDQTAARRRFRRIDECLRKDLGVPASPELENLLKRATLQADTTDQPRIAPAVSANGLPQSVRTARRWPLWAAVFVALLIAAGAGLYRWTLTEAPPTIAVLPFEDVGGKQAFLAAGVSDEVLNLLSSQPNLKLMGRLTAQEIGARPNSRAVAQELGVTHLLDGSVRSTGDRLLIIVRLTRVSDGAQLWSERYERRAGDIFALQADIARAVAARLSRSLETGVQHATSPVVYELYLAARRLARERRQLTLHEADRLLRRAIQLDPGYAPPYAELAQVIMLRSNHPTAYGTTPFAEAQKEATGFARKAIALDPNLGDGYAALGFLSLNLNGSAEPYMRKAVELSPQRPEFHRWHGETLAALNRYDEALEGYRKAVEIDPLWGLNYEHLISALFAVGRDDEALAHVRRFLALSSDARAENLLLLSLHKGQNDLAGQLKASLALWRAYPDERQMRFNLASALAQLGERQRAAEVIARDPLARAALIGDWPELERQAEALGPAFWSQSRIWNTAALMIEAGREGALVRFYDRDRVYFERELDAKEIALPELIVALRQAGRDREATTLLRSMAARTRTLPDKGYLRLHKLTGEIVVASLSGSTDGALSLLDQQSRERPLALTTIPLASLRFDPALKAISTDRRFQVIDERVRVAVNAERAKAGLAPISASAWASNALPI
jgi:DNA-binding SARP family transcriptional activator/TolB-like protein/Tfp pilus assembly protein PilF